MTIHSGNTAHDMFLSNEMASKQLYLVETRQVSFIYCGAQVRRYLKKNWKSNLI